MLVTSSGGAACLIDRRADRVVWYAKAPNAHSADLIRPSPLLPGPERVVVAASHLDDHPGDRLILYDLDRPERELLSIPLPWGHGAVWDSLYKTVWALDHTHLSAYKVADWHTGTPKLVPLESHPLPSPGGHELSGGVNSPYLEVTASNDAWRVDTRIPGFVPHPLFAAGRRAHIKRIALHPNLPWLAYVQAPGTPWWSESVHLIDLTAVQFGADPAAVTHTIHVPGAHFYKVRWNG